MDIIQPVLVYATPTVMLGVAGGAGFYFLADAIAYTFNENKWFPPLLGVLVGIGAGALLGFRINTFLS